MLILQLVLLLYFSFGKRQENNAFFITIINVMAFNESPTISGIFVDAMGCK